VYAIEIERSRDVLQALWSQGLTGKEAVHQPRGRLANNYCVGLGLALHPGGNIRRLA
jgi:hypothetical protein